MNDELYERLVAMRKEILEKELESCIELDALNECSCAYEFGYDEGFWSGQLHIIELVLGEIK